MSDGDTYTSPPEHNQPPEGLPDVPPRKVGGYESPVPLGSQRPMMAQPPPGLPEEFHSFWRALQTASPGQFMGEALELSKTALERLAAECLARDEDQLAGMKACNEVLAECTQLRAEVERLKEFEQYAHNAGETGAKWHMQLIRREKELVDAMAELARLRSVIVVKDAALDKISEMYSSKHLMAGQIAREARSVQ